MKKMYRHTKAMSSDIAFERGISRQWKAIGREISERADWEAGVARIQAASKSRTVTK